MDVAKGNFLVACTLTELLLDKVIAIADIDGYHPGLCFLYTSFLDRICASLGERSAAIRIILGLIVTAERPPQREVLLDCLLAEAQLRLPDVNIALARLRSLLAESESGVRLFHKSFSDWLTNEPTRYQVDANESHALWAHFVVRTLSSIPVKDSASVAYAGFSAVLHLHHVRDFASIAYLAESKAAALHLRMPTPTQLKRLFEDCPELLISRILKSISKIYGDTALNTYRDLDLEIIERTAGSIETLKASQRFSGRGNRLYDYCKAVETFIEVLRSAAFLPALGQDIIDLLDEYDALYTPISYLATDHFTCHKLGHSGQLSDFAHGALDAWTTLCNELSYQPSDVLD